MLGEGEERATNSKLNLVDLAGSERTKKTGVTGQALKVSHWLILVAIVFGSMLDDRQSRFVLHAMHTCMHSALPG